MTTTTETSASHRLDIPADGFESWVDVTVMQQRRTADGSLSLLSVEWVTWTRVEQVGGRPLTMTGPSGKSYWFPAADGRSGEVYSQGRSSGSSYGFQFTTDDTFTACDLLNLASATWDGQTSYVDHSGTNPFRAFVG